MTSYIAAHRPRLRDRHYITNARSVTQWYNFYAGKLAEYCRMYGDEFCLVINCCEQYDNAYVMPFKEVKEMFSPEYLNGTRWVGNVIRDNLSVSLGGKPMQEMYVGNFLNAFELLQDAPRPLPAKPELPEFA